MDSTETLRRMLTPVVNSLTDDGVATVNDNGETFTTEEMTAAFNVDSFAAPFVVVRRKSDGVRGTLMFRHSPRVYFDFTPEG